MSVDERLAAIVTGLDSVGAASLIMGGHAVRFYGLQRNTIDFDLHLAPDRWGDLPELLWRTNLFSKGLPVEGESWRPASFRRFQIGRLPDGREEWLEFWRSNHLLPAFDQLYGRREIGRYGGQMLPFLSLPDLIRSKETERDFDWHDVATLEEFLDARNFVQVEAGKLDAAAALSKLRSRVGLERFLQANRLKDVDVVSRALSSADNLISQAILLPFAPSAPLADVVPVLEPLVISRLRRMPAASSLHLALIEAARRQYRNHRQAVDKADKQAVRREQAK